MRGQKRTVDEINAIIAVYACTNNYSKTARMLGLAPSTVKDVVERNKDKAEYVELSNNIKASFSDRAKVIIDKMLDRIEFMLDDDEADIAFNQLAQMLNVLFDKMRLANGDSTENTAVEIKLPPGAEEYAM